MEAQKLLLAKRELSYLTLMRVLNVPYNYLRNKSNFNLALLLLIQECIFLTK